MHYQTAEESVSTCFSDTFILLLFFLHFHSNTVIMKQNIHRIETLLFDPAVDVRAQDENEFTSLTVALLMNKSELTQLPLQYKDILNNKAINK